MTQALPSKRISRRRFLRWTGGIVLGGSAVSGLYAWRFEPHWLEVVERDLPIDGLPESLIGKKLVQLSDLHIGPVVDDDYLRGVFRIVAEHKPDIVAITGDFMTCQRDEQLDHVERVLEDLPAGRFATLAVLGNHDYGRGWSQESVADALSTRLHGRDIRVLRNEVDNVDGLQIAGFDDLWSPQFSPEGVVSKLDEARPALAICHNPDVADLPIWSKYRGWILAGHTHGGQCTLPFMRPPLLPVKNKRYVRGEIAVSGGRTMYINRGIGYIRRVRFCVRPEITVFTMKGV